MVVARGKLKPLHDNIVVVDMNFDERKTKSGLVLLSDDGKAEGVRHRWGRVWAVGPEQEDVKVGEWILLEHGRWSRGFKYEDPTTGEVITIRRGDPKAILAVSDHEPNEDDMGKFNTVTHPTFDFTN
jgi:co-chaperonin GroES (HSP10)